MLKKRILNVIWHTVTFLIMCTMYNNQVQENWHTYCLKHLTRRIMLYFFKKMHQDMDSHIECLFVCITVLVIFFRKRWNYDVKICSLARVTGLRFNSQNPIPPYSHHLKFWICLVLNVNATLNHLSAIGTPVLYNRQVAFGVTKIQL